MYTNNPYAQGGWSYAGNGHSVNRPWGDGFAPAPSVFGALPYPTSPPPSDLVTFQFSSFNPTILNCTILGPHSRPSFRITTDSSMPGYTVVKNAEGKNIALIEWQARPYVEVRGILPKQSIRHWLRLSPDQRCASCLTSSQFIG